MIFWEFAKPGKYDLIIPFPWWHDQHPLKNIADAMKCVFQEAKCHAHIEDEVVADLFEWDKTVAYEEEAQNVGSIVRANEGEVQLETLPKPYRQYKEPFEATKVEMLEPRRTFDHAINLKERIEPQWGPICPMSAHVLNELDKDIKKMLAHGKIGDTKSPYGAPMRFVPKRDGN